MNLTIGTARAVLRYGLAVLMAAAGLHALFVDQTAWSSYLAPAAVELLPLQVSVFMAAIAVCEVVAAVMLLVPGLAVYGAGMSALLLLGITVNVAVGGTATDIVIRDVGLVGYAVGCTLLFAATENH